MKILHLLGWYLPSSVGGTELYVDALARRQIAAGHQVAVAAPEAGAAAARRYAEGGVPVFRYPIPRDARRDEAQGERPARGVGALHQLLGETRPDIVHVHNLGLGLGVHELRIARRVGARPFVTAHTSGLGYLCLRGTLMCFGREPCDGRVTAARCAACALHDRGLPEGAARLAARIPPAAGALLGRLPGKPGTLLGMTRLVERNLRREEAVFDLVERFVVLTRAAFEILAGNGLPRHKLVLNPLGIARQVAPKPAAPTRLPLRLGFLGRLDPIKGIEDLVAAVRRAPALPLTLEIRGPGEAGRLRQLAAGDARIRFGEAVAPEEAPALLRSWDLVCCPSRCLEGGPTVALEAHAAGTPVVGSGLGGLLEIVKDPERLHAPGDVDGIARLLARAAADPAGTIDRWRGALGAVRTMDDVARDTEAMYRGEPTVLHA